VPRRALLALGALLVLAGSARGQAPDLAVGRTVYEANCAICHGERGDGKGHAAHHFLSAPRDLTAGRYKFRSTATGQLPTDDDLRRSIVTGIPGTGMVPQNHLSDADVQTVIEFIKSLSPRFAAAPEGARPTRRESAGSAMGRRAVATAHRRRTSRSSRPISRAVR
jgi:mono/diheme cytochrome c family protein